MTEAETAGETVAVATVTITVPDEYVTSVRVTDAGGVTGPGADPYPGDTLTVTDPLNAAIAATAGEVPDTTEARDAAVKRSAAMEAYIKAGVEKMHEAAWMFGLKTDWTSGDNRIVTTGSLRAAFDQLLRHLHLDHPENYLPK